MLARALADYGGPFRDALPIEDPQTQMSSDQYNRLAEDGAQMTRTAWRAIASFQTSTTTDPTVADAVSVWGTETVQQPTIHRVSAGVYTLTYPTAFLDALNVPESVSFRFASASIDGPAPGHARTHITGGNVVTLYVFDNTFAASDLNGVLVTVWLR